MTTPAIRVENLGKKYLISHQQRERYTALRDVLTNKAKGLGRKIIDLGRSPVTRAPSKEEFWALKDVSFEVQPGERIGIIGRNGAGKSTLLKLLSRITEPSAGRIELNGRVGSLLEVGTGFHPELTGRENIFLNGAILGMSKEEITRRFDEIVAFADIERFLDTPLKRYSSGMYVRLAFSVAAHMKTEILIVDEVLSVGDAKFQELCIGKMQEAAESGRTVLFVSHNMEAVSRLCSRGLLLDSGRLEMDRPVGATIEAYLGRGNLGEVGFANGPLSRVMVQQLGQEIRIRASYQLDAPLRLPCLGFVISDSLGHPICGGNPKNDDIYELKEPKAEGEVRASISQPRLLDGTYRLSIWFGNGSFDFVYYRDCLTFEVAGMASGQLYPAAAVGSVKPQVEWTFE